MDVDPAEIGKNRAADIPIVGSLEHVIPKLAEALESRSNGGPPKAADWLETVRGWQRDNPFRYRNTPPLKPEYVIERLRELTARPGRDLDDRRRASTRCGRRSTSRSTSRGGG